MPFYSRLPSLCAVFLGQIYSYLLYNYYLGFLCFIITFAPMIADKVYKNGFKAELMGNTITAVHA